MLHAKFASRSRSGFTLVELLVVLAIILVILALTASAFMQVLTVQRRGNTEQTIITAQKLLEKQWSAVVSQADKEDVTDPSLSAVLTMAGGDLQRAKVILKKLRLQQAFPTSFNEVFAGSVLPTTRAALNYQTALTNAGFTAANLPSPIDPSESSVLLLLAFQQSLDGTTVPEDVLGSSTVADSQWTTLRLLVDGWGQPLTFIRWPIGYDPVLPTDSAAVAATKWPNVPLGNTELNVSYNPATSGRNSTGMPLTSFSNFCDPLDPDGTLLNPSWNSSTSSNLTTFETLCHPVHWVDPTKPAAISWTPQAVYNIPVIISSGPNGNLPNGLGLNASMLVINVDGANDNIYSYRLRLGGKGD
jgi:prepilin-type N-terminal cleavage/methylation domain-containing protein